MTGYSKKIMKQKIIPILIILFGFALLSYPFISNYMFEKSAGSTIKSYEKQAKTYDQKQKEQAFREAEEYNKDLIKSAVQLTDPFKVKKSNGETLIYNNILNIDHSGVMGYLEIPSISVNLPIYHGTDAEILERGVGHLAASSIPVGGKSTHSVLTGHTGLSSAKLFTDLTEMKKEDLFFIHVLDRTLAYKVDQISVVRPEDTRKLQIVKGKDYVTLVTCTPYGVNDHRLLVRGVRTKYVKKQRSSIRPRNQDSQWMKTYKKAIAIGLMIVTALILLGKVFQKLHRKKTEHRQINRKKGREE
ncbi:sortase family protein [Firmicutes bacterium CAG:270]|nr:sortase family protein [Firmicutes bacterium CAG:270]